MVESMVTRKGKECREIRYFITSVTYVKQFAKGVRRHWAIENNLHWSLSGKVCKWIYVMSADWTPFVK